MKNFHPYLYLRSFYCSFEAAKYLVFTQLQNISFVSILQYSFVFLPILLKTINCWLFFTFAFFKWIFFGIFLMSNLCSWINFSVDKLIKLNNMDNKVYINNIDKNISELNIEDFLNSSIGNVKSCKVSFIDIHDW